jgi:hypothetical protein
MNYEECTTSALLKLVASRVYFDAEKLRKASYFNGVWSDERDERQYENEMRLYGALRKHAER